MAFCILLSWKIFHENSLHLFNATNYKTAIGYTSKPTVCRIAATNSWSLVQQLQVGDQRSFRVHMLISCRPCALEENASRQPKLLQWRATFGRRHRCLLVLFIENFMLTNFNDGARQGSKLGLLLLFCRIEWIPISLISANSGLQSWLCRVYFY